MKQEQLKITYRHLSSLKKYEKNSRIHPPEQIEQIRKSIKEFGFTNPILIKSDGEIIAGHGRLEAAQGIIDPVPCIVLDYLTPEQVRALVIADNKIAENAGWDLDILSSELEALEGANFDMDLTGFNEKELDLIFDGVYKPVNNNVKKELSAKEDDYEEPTGIVKTDIKPGDYIRIGRHRLFCGSYVDADFGVSPQMVFTDPPYGVAIGEKNKMLNSFQKAGRNLTDIVSDAETPDTLKNILLPIFKKIKDLMVDDCTVFVTAPQVGDLGMMMMMMMRDAGLPVRHVLIWKKNAPTFSMGRLDYDYQHEPILLTWGKKHAFYGKGQFKTSVWEIDKPRAAKEHPTMKPVALVENALLNNSKENAIILDAFMGSGTTMVAAHQLNRVAIGCEIEPHYCQVIIDRMKKLDPEIEIEKIS